MTWYRSNADYISGIELNIQVAALYGTFVITLVELYAFCIVLT